ncbi:hypothetical protein D3C87_67070 [compost metagenome]
MAQSNENKITYQFYDAFEKVEVDGWDNIVDKDVAINSPAAFNMSGLQVLKEWTSGFTELAYQIDLTDEYL